MGKSRPVPLNGTYPAAGYDAASDLSGCGVPATFVLAIITAPGTAPGDTRLARSGWELDPDGASLIPALVRTREPLPAGCGGRHYPVGDRCVSPPQQPTAPPTPMVATDVTQTRRTP